MESTDQASGVTYHVGNLEAGKQYLKVDNMLFPCPSTVDVSALPPNQEVLKVIAKQMGRVVLEHDFSYASKSGFGVRQSEVEAMELVSEHTAVPVPEIMMAGFSGYRGNIHMSIIPGKSLDTKWATLHDDSKRSVCIKLWDMIAEWRKIPRPSKLNGLFQCLADGSPSRDPLLQDLKDPPRPIFNDSELRERIYERYLNCGGLRYENTLPDMLPRSSESVFTHGDLAPRNIMVDDHNYITGILDWEYAGWYPDYWEYAQIMRPAFDGDFKDWMDQTAPEQWDLTGINASRKVLF